MRRRSGAHPISFSVFRKTQNPGNFAGMKHLATLALVIISCVSCLGPTINTRSGRPEVSIPSTTVDAVSNALIAEYVSKGFAITQQSANALVFERQGDTSYNVAYGYGSMIRRSFSFIPQSGDVVVYCAPAVVRANDGRVIDDPNAYAPAQMAMERVRASLGGAPTSQTAVIP